MSKGPDDSLMGLSSFSTLGRLASKGNKLATLISAFAFAFSAVSFYETVMKQPKLSVYVPPVINYGRDGGGDTEVFAVPLTIVNEGAQSGTVLALELIVENPAPQEGFPARKTHYSAFMGEHPRDGNAINKAFAPISIAGRSSYSDTVRFYPQGNALPHIVRAEGDYAMTLSLRTAAPREPTIIDRLFRHGDPAPATFIRTLPYLSSQHLGFRRGTISMHAKDWQPVTATAKEGKSP